MKNKFNDDLKQARAAAYHAADTADYAADYAANADTAANTSARAADYAAYTAIYATHTAAYTAIYAANTANAVYTNNNQLKYQINKVLELLSDKRENK